MVSSKQTKKGWVIILFVVLKYLTKTRQEKKLQYNYVDLWIESNDHAFSLFEYETDNVFTNSISLLRFYDIDFSFAHLGWYNTMLIVFTLMLRTAWATFLPKLIVNCLEINSSKNEKGKRESLNRLQSTSSNNC